MKEEEYLSFITNEDLFSAIEKLYNCYLGTKKEVTLAQFYNNKIDPIKLLFDTKFLERTIEETIEIEMLRKNDRTISNAIGTFNEELAGAIKGYKRFSPGTGYDIKSDDNSFYADIKNKHNTVTGTHNESLYKKLEGFLYMSDDLESKAYYAQIIANKTMKKPWVYKKTKPKKEGEKQEYIEYKNPRVYKISADELYKEMTGIDDAFKQLCEALPIAINDFLKDKDKTVVEESKVVQLITKEAEEKEVTIIQELFNNTFSTYIGFPIK